jgi:hypothetical protein
MFPVRCELELYTLLGSNSYFDSRVEAGLNTSTVALRVVRKKKKKKLHGLSPRANYTDRATAASRRSVANLCG